MLGVGGEGQIRFAFDFAPLSLSASPFPQGRIRKQPAIWKLLLIRCNYTIEILPLMRQLPVVIGNYVNGSIVLP